VNRISFVDNIQKYFDASVIMVCERKSTPNWLYFWLSGAWKR
jgi:hypothetical protein